MTNKILLSSVFPEGYMVARSLPPNNSPAPKWQVFGSLPKVYQTSYYFFHLFTFHSVVFLFDESKVKLSLMPLPHHT